MSAGAEGTEKKSGRENGYGDGGAISAGAQCNGVLECGKSQHQDMHR